MSAEFIRRSHYESSCRAQLVPTSTEARTATDTAGNTDGSVPQHLDSVLNDEMLARFASRAATYDRENRFFTEDFEELRAVEILLLSLPVEFGGQGRVLAEVCRELRRLAYHAPATALAVNMHLYWIGVAADLWRGRRYFIGVDTPGGRSRWKSSPPDTQKAAMTCQFSFQRQKRSALKADTDITGTKQFGSLTPVWTRFGIHANGHQQPCRTKDHSRIHGA